MAPSKVLPLADYLFARLKQLGVGAVHGVPGDYNLTLLDHVEPSGLLWVGNANELNAGYATDGYARIKGLGALVTTFGVGELSAANSIAGAFSERVPVVSIVGSPARSSSDSRLMIHHALGDGNYDHFRQMAAHITVAQTVLLDPRTCPAQIDQTLEQCLLHSRPVYIQIPVDMVSVEVSAENLSRNLLTPRDLTAAPIPKYGEEVIQRVVDRMHAAKQPVIIVDGETRGLGIADGVRELVTATGWPTFTTGFGANVIDLSLPNCYGIFSGSVADSRVQQFMSKADLVLCFGPHWSSTNTTAWSAVPAREKTISFTPDGVQIDSEPISRDIPAAYAVSQLRKALDLNKAKQYEAGIQLPKAQLASFADISSSDLIKHDRVWPLLANFLRTGDVVLGETGTAGYGVREMAMPKDTKLFVPVTWLSIGYMLPATQGVALATRELASSSSPGRTLLFIGDGSFQMTAQELSTMIRLNLDVVVFLLNNDGYTIERCIHGPKQGYNDVSRWRYLRALDFFGASSESAYVASARTYGELQQILQSKELADGKGVRMVELHMDRFDAPAGQLKEMMAKQLEMLKVQEEKDKTK